MTRVLITGITGQDGSYLSEFLLNKGYEVHGLIRRVSLGHGNLRNIEHIKEQVHLHHGDLGDATSLYNIINKVKPHEIYNLAAQADVKDSYSMPEYTIDVNGLGVVRLLEAVRMVDPQIRIYQASTSELYSGKETEKQNEETTPNPQSPYAMGKYLGYQAIKKYREMYGLFACNGILFNHASPRRGEDYVDRKITKAVARIYWKKQNELRLGNLKSKRDWGYSKEYVEYMWKMLQQKEPDDYVLGTGETHTVEEWLNEAFAYVNLDPKKYVVQDKRFFRPAEVDVLHADYTKAKERFGFEPQVRFKELVRLMVDEDIKNEGI